MNVYLSVSPYTFSIELVVMVMPHDSLYPIIFGRAFFNNVNAEIDCKEGTIYFKFAKEQAKFHFSKSREKPYNRDFEDQ
jgi:hypothetical protein